MDAALPQPEPSADLRASWERSRAHGLAPDQPLPHAPVARGELGDRLEANARLLTFSRPVIENLYRQIGSPSSTVLLADSQGLILSAVGDPDFMDRAARVALSPGARWTEDTMGTNAIGTALHAGTEVTVRGQEHFLARNRFLTCVAMPILAPAGGVLGILDVSSDARADISHADALLRTTAELIEHQLIESLDDGFLTLRFHRHAELLGSPLEALTVFDEGGRLVASNRPARALLGLNDEQPSALCAECFATSWAGLVGWAALRQNTPFPLLTARGHTYAARAGLRPPRPRGARRHANEGSAPYASHLAAMDLGEPRMTALIETLRRASPDAAPLLLEGETGSGKTHLVRALHHDQSPPEAPLATLDCPLLAAGGAPEAEALDALHRAGAGILVLREVGALAVPLQGRLLREAAACGGARIVATTTRPLAELVAAGHFADEAFAAQGGRRLALPPLRERTDFDALVRLFVREACPERTVFVCPDALTRLRAHRWPGNLRELRNQLRLILALMGDDAGQLCPEDIPPELFDEDGGGDY